MRERESFQSRPHKGPPQGPRWDVGLDYSVPACVGTLVISRLIRFYLGARGGVSY